MSKNVIFGIPKNREEFLTLCFLIVIACSFLVNVYSNGKATLIFIKNEYDIKPDSLNYNLTPEYQTIQKYANLTQFTDNRINIAILILIFIILPGICFYYAFFVFKKSDWDINVNSEKDILQNINI
jgi:ABC-type transport system involved in multi-copper enzyme maturation permease subunit